MNPHSVPLAQLAWSPGDNTEVSVVVVYLVLASTTDAPTGLARVLPVEIHAVVDFALAFLLIAAPFLFGFRDKGGATAFFIVLGVAHLLLTIATRFREPRPA